MIEDYILVLAVAIYLVVSPYSKVEESFNVQAIHDIVYYGRDLASYDHIEFPGVVPRTFLGALGVGSLIAPLKGVLTKPEMQLLARAILGALNAWALIYFRRAVAILYGPKRGAQTAKWFVWLVLGQFHMLFYASRTLPNFICLPLVLVSYAWFIQYKYTASLRLLAFTAVVFRSELVILWGCIGMGLLGSTKVSFLRVFMAGLVGSLIGVATTVAFDSYFWQHFPSFPELEGVIFNVFHGKSSEWGTEPWEAYFTTHLPNLLANPMLMVFALFGARVTPWNLRLLFMCGVAYVGIYSFQPHKELRFVVYVAPLWTVLAARAIDYIGYAQSRKSIVVRLGYRFMQLLTLAMVGVSLLKLYISSENYPGGYALEYINQHAERGATVHFDVASCMTGVSKFGQYRQDLIYDKTENETLASKWEQFDYYVGAEPLDTLEWTLESSIYAFKHISRVNAIRSVKNGQLLASVLKCDLRSVVDAIIIKEPTIFIYRKKLKDGLTPPS